MAGEIETVRKEVKRFKIGELVYAYHGINLEAPAEYVYLPEKAVTKRPVNATDEEAAIVLQGALTASFFLRKVKDRPGIRS